jgi:cytoskeletal protein RodZ
METDKKPAPEETPAVEPVTSEPAVVEPVVNEPKKPAAEPQKKSFWNKLILWIIVALVFFVGGMALIYFTLYKNATTATSVEQQKVTNLQSQLSTAQDDLATAKQANSQLQTEIDSVKADLTTAQGTIDTQAAEIQKANQLTTVYKFLSDVNTARAVLETLDISSTRQAINFAKADLADLESTGLDAASISGFKDRLDEAEINLNEPDLLTSRDALNTLYQNILLLIDNLK